MRSRVRVPLNLDANIVVKLASTPEERAGAFKVLHDAYVDMGFCQPQPNGMRTVPHHSLPRTPIIIAKDGDKVVGTLTLADDETLDLPLEKSWTLDRYRAGNGKVLEVTCFAIERSYRRCNNKNVFFPLIQFMYQFASSVLEADYLVIATHPKVRDFYEGVLFFDPIDTRVIEDYIGAPAIAMSLELKHLPLKYLNVYGKRPSDQNLYSYFVDYRVVDTAAAYVSEGLATDLDFDSAKIKPPYPSPAFELETPRS
ncbi:MAG: N-acyl amino acid synthase FeeM domain-containing protein [Bdellovibrionia bacterium]